MRPSYRKHEDPYTGKTIYLYWDGPQNPLENNDITPKTRNTTKTFLYSTGYAAVSMLRYVNFSQALVQIGQHNRLKYPQLGLISHRPVAYHTLNLQSSLSDRTNWYSISVLVPVMTANTTRPNGSMRYAYSPVSATALRWHTWGTAKTAAQS